MKISWVDRISTEEVLAQVSEMRTWTRKHRWTGHVLYHSELLCNLMEGIMAGKPTTGRRRLQMLDISMKKVRCTGAHPHS